MFNWKNRYAKFLVVALLGVFIFTGCSNQAVDSAEGAIEEDEEQSESAAVNEDVPDNDMDPDYETVFNQEEVLVFNIKIENEDWLAMQEDLAGNKTQGQGNQGGMKQDTPRDRATDADASSQEGLVPNMPPDREASQDMAADADAPSQEGLLPNMPPDRGASQDMAADADAPSQESVVPNMSPNREAPQDMATNADAPNQESVVPNMPPNREAPQDMAADAVNDKDSSSDSDPIWVESAITVNNITWEHVGIRYKGNSSLTSAYSSGNSKLSFKLDFDEFEDDYPEIENQRFYGFKQLNLNSNFSDVSLMREKVAADLFREFGLVSSQTSFCVVNIDYGEGSMFYGVYALVEEIDDTGLSQFEDDDGNLYKPDGRAASFASGTYNEDQMEKKSNEDEGDYTDVNSLYEIINGDLRETDVTTWKTELEATFNVDGFLKWLAANTVMQNWDTYGNMTHNYFLYNDPETGQLNWIPWDNNEAFSDGKGNRGALSIGLSEVNEEWPLINYLVNDTEYRAIYDAYVQEFVDEVFTVEKMTETYTSYYEMIKDYAYEEVEGFTYLKSDDDFDNGVEALKAHVVKRSEAVEKYLEE
jgi:spore coat protein CotH